MIYLASDHGGYLLKEKIKKFLSKMNLKYGSDGALELLENIIKTMKQNAKSIAIAPSGTTSRLLKTTPSIEPKEETTYLDELKTMTIIQNHIF